MEDCFVEMPLPISEERLGMTEVSEEHGYGAAPSGPIVPVVAAVAGYAVAGAFAAAVDAVAAAVAVESWDGREYQMRATQEAAQWLGRIRSPQHPHNLTWSKILSLAGGVQRVMT